MIGVYEVILLEELRVKFVKLIFIGILLKIKFGLDLFVLDVYLGYMVVLNKFC